MSDYARAQVNPRDLQGWTDKATIPFHFAYAWGKYMPRGKGWFPRKVGTLLCRNMRHTILTRYGAILAVEPSSLDVYTTILRDDGSWNPHVLRACHRVLEQGGSFFDIGANVGYISIEIANLFNDGVEVTAFEPQPSLARIIAISAALNGFKHLNVHAAMVGQDVGHGDLFVPAHSIHASAIPRKSNAPHIKCPKFSIDYLDEHNVVPRPSVIKIDVEGGEIEVIKGASNTIKKYAPFIVFESDINMARFGYTRSYIVSLIENLSEYTFFAISDEKLLPLSSSEEHGECADIMAVPVGKRGLVTRAMDT